MPITFLLVDQSSPIFLFNRAGDVVDQVHFRFSLRGSFTEIFAIKMEHCEKSRKILDVFALKILLGQPF